MSTHYRSDAPLAALRQTGYRLALAIVGKSSVAEAVTRAAIESAHDGDDWVSLLADIRSRSIRKRESGGASAVPVGPPDEGTLVRDSAILGVDTIAVAEAFASLPDRSRETLHAALLGSDAMRDLTESRLATALLELDAAIVTSRYPSEEDIP